jgi:hypothetical protein
MRYTDILNEIQIGGDLDTSHFDDLKQNDFKTKQLDLFPDIPTLAPNLPQDYEELGRIGAYYVARKMDNDGTQPWTAIKQQPEYSYVVFDKGEVISYVSMVIQNLITTRN